MTRPRVRALLGEAAERYGVSAAVALASLGVAFNSGSFGLMVRSQLAIVLWWALALAVALAILPLRRPTRAAALAGGLLAAYTALAAVSIAWSDSAETAFNEFNRNALYLGVFVLAVAAGGRERLRQWTTGLAIGLGAVVVVALAARLFPDLVASQTRSALFRGDARAVYPLSYWNGLAVFAALALPLLLHTALATRARLWRGLALALVPGVAALIYMTASRGGALAALAGALLFVALTNDRLRTALATLVGAAGAALAVAMLSARSALVDGPLDSSAAASQGRSGAVLLALVCALTGLAWALAPSALPRLALSRAVKLGLAALGVALVAAAVVAADPAQRLEAF
jgi:hypothetical protein